MLCGVTHYTCKWWKLGEAWKYGHKRAYTYIASSYQIMIYTILQQTARYDYLVHQGDLLLLWGPEHDCCLPQGPPQPPPVFSMSASQTSPPGKWRRRKRRRKRRRYFYCQLEQLDMTMAMLYVYQNLFMCWPEEYLFWRWARVCFAQPMAQMTVDIMI